MPTDRARQTALSRRLAELARRAPMIVGHRGAAATHPENTLVSFTAGVDAGASMIELDCHATADGVLVCLHDETLDRTTDAAAVLGRTGVRADALTLRELARFDAGSWKHTRFADARIPSLEAALRCIQPRAVTMIEHKAGAASTLVELLRGLHLIDAVLVQSFDWSWLAEVRALEPRLTLGALGEGELTPEHLSTIASLGTSLVHWDRAALRAEDVEVLRQRGYLTCLYTINDDFGLVGAGALGIDAIVTDAPARLRELVARGVVRRP